MFAGKADILCYNKNEVIEVEIKISKSDLLHDIEKKKHLKYSVGKVWNMPNKFYYCVPYQLEKDALNLIKKINPNYGLIIIDTNLEKDNIVFIKRAKCLKEKIEPKMPYYINYRCSSELINLRLKNNV